MKRNGIDIRTLLKAAAITALAYVVSLLIASPFSASTSSIFSSAEQNDFELPDLFMQMSDNRPVRSLDNRIVLVDIGHADRAGIAHMLDVISLSGARSVGMDVNFVEPRGDDSHLIKAVAGIPGIVLPVEVKEHDGKFVVDAVPFFLDSISDYRLGVVNLASAGDRHRIREFTYSFAMADGDTLRSYSQALAEDYDPAAARRSLERAGLDNADIIDYPSREFTIIDGEDIDEYAELLTDKIVILGARADSGDMHSTPVNSYMAGMEIHAHSLATILNGKRLMKVPGYVDKILAVLICYIIVLMTISIKALYRGALIRILQVLLVFGVVWMGYTMLMEQGWIMNLSSALLMIAFGIFAVDIWNGGVWLVGKIKGIFISRKDDTPY